jgi:hypothetical protein
MPARARLDHRALQKPCVTTKDASAPLIWKPKRLTIEVGQLPNTAQPRFSSPRRRRLYSRPGLTVRDGLGQPFRAGQTTQRLRSSRIQRLREDSRSDSVAILASTHSQGAAGRPDGSTMTPAQGLEERDGLGRPVGGQTSAWPRRASRPNRRIRCSLHSFDPIPPRAGSGSQRQWLAGCDPRPLAPPIDPEHHYCGLGTGLLLLPR